MREAGSHSFTAGIPPRSPRSAGQSSCCSPPCRSVATLATALMTFGQLVSLHPYIRHRRRHPHSSSPSRSSRCCSLRRFDELVGSIVRHHQCFSKQNSASSKTMGRRFQAQIGCLLDRCRRCPFRSHIDSIRLFQRIVQKTRAFKGADPRLVVSSFATKKPAAGSQM